MDAPVRTNSRYWVLLGALACLGLAGLVGLFVVQPRTHWFDRLDLRIYYNSSRWVAGEGQLYADVHSEYPLAANLLFAVCRLAGDLLPGSPGGMTGFSWCWMAGGWLTFVLGLHLLATRVSRNSLWLWLTPGAMYFALVRYDIYPAVATLLALLALQQGQLWKGALWLGVVLALKGYALFLLPAFGVYVLQQRGWRTALGVLVVALAPFVLGNLAVWGYGGWDSMLAPFRFHAQRTNNGESSYDALYYLAAFLYAEQPDIGGSLPVLLQVLCSLLAAACQPRSFADLVHSFLVALLGFISFSLFYSPQFCLWVLPIACFAASTPLRRTALVFGWLSFLYFPVTIVYGAKGLTLATAALQGHWVRLLLFRACIVLTTVARFTLLIQAGLYFLGRRQPLPNLSESVAQADRLQVLVPLDRMSLEGRNHANQCPST